MRHPVEVGPSSEPGMVDLEVQAHDPYAFMTPAEARDLAARLLAAADEVENTRSE